jgi:hypothetical protein
MPGTSFNVTAMAEGAVANQSDDSRRTGKGKMASGMRLNLGSPMVVVRSPGGRRSSAADEVLRRRRQINAGRSFEKRRETEKRSTRCGISPGTCWRTRKGRGSSVAAGMFTGARWLWWRNDDLGVDWSGTNAIPLARMTRTTGRI